LGKTILLATRKFYIGLLWRLLSKEASW